MTPTKPEIRPKISALYQGRRSPHHVVTIVIATAVAMNPDQVVATTIAMNTKTLVKIVGAIAMLLGSAISISAVMAYWELKSLERSGKPRSEDSLPLTKFVGPELLDTRYAGLKPSILAKAITFACRRKGANHG